MTDSVSPSFRLAYVPGVTPGKWVRIWQERLPEVPLVLVGASAAQAPGLLKDGGADVGVVRLPVERPVLAAIPLYTETTVVVVPRGHLLTAVEEVALEDLAEYVVFHPLDDTLVWECLPGRAAIERPPSTQDALELVAAGVGVVLVPQSLARLHHRKDLVFRPVTDAPVSSVVLSWLEERTTDLVEDFIGIVRGRTLNSTRGRKAVEGRSGRGEGGAATGKSRGSGRSGAAAGGRSGGGRSGGGRSGGGRSGGGGRGGTSGRAGARRGKPGKGS